MTNQETQLELDFGMLTVAQQERVDSFIKNQKEQTSNNIKNSNTVETLLNEGGFIKGVDYEVSVSQDKNKQKDKMDLANRNSSNESRKIEQRSNNLPAMSFESSEDQINGDIGMNEVSIDK